MPKTFGGTPEWLCNWRGKTALRMVWLWKNNQEHLKGKEEKKKKTRSCNSLVGSRRIAGEREKRGKEKINKRTVLRGDEN